MSGLTVVVDASVGSDERHNVITRYSVQMLHSCPGKVCRSGNSRGSRVARSDSG